MISTNKKEMGRRDLSDSHVNIVFVINTKEPLIKAI